MNRNKKLIPIIIFTAVIIFCLIVLHPNIRYKNLNVNETKWNSIIESRIKNEKLILTDIEFNDYKLIIDKSSNIIYYSAVNNSKNKYNPSVGYSINTKNTKLAFFKDEITDEKVKSNYKFKVMIYNDKEYNLYDLICTDLPIVNIRYREDIEDKSKKMLMEIFIFNNLSNTTNKVSISRGKLKISENNYMFSLNKLTPGKNIRENKISILNMNPNSEYKLTIINNEEENENYKGQRVELFINDEYKGIYYLECVQKENKEKYER